MYLWNNWISMFVFELHFPTCQCKSCNVNASSKMLLTITTETEIRDSPNPKRINIMMSRRVDPFRWLCLHLAWKTFLAARHSHVHVSWISRQPNVGHFCVGPHNMPTSPTSNVAWTAGIAALCKAMQFLYSKQRTQS